MQQHPRESFVAPVQMTMAFEDQPAETCYQLSHRAFWDGIDRYIADHEILVKTMGRANGQCFSQYYEPHRFPFYHDHRRGLAYLAVKKNVAKSFLIAAGLNEAWPAISIDYEAMLPFLPPITGAWFSELQLQYIRSAGYFGQHIDRSDQYKLAEAIGKTSVLYVNVAFPNPSGPEYRVGITAEGSVTIDQTLELEEDELDLVCHVYDAYIEPTLAARTG